MKRHVVSQNLDKPTDNVGHSAGQTAPPSTPARTGSNGLPPPKASVPNVQDHGRIRFGAGYRLKTSK